ncbi:hypothetical protein K450DRAFT_248926 [Umbelopsis ramanniana AG]|uniref:RRM domain-containing protein n=1 Tax=Umbelopsis ramanniana AG TaxID=1314678 RepID=A0AAD5E9F3_UMBRA|nr:uncharacterized protein K450DRAFT_248926 [Umbelopsis ramanniana AG]KAI8578080.1 hypothetical protein K450DRAFT_248926 [Umbelopsis ramanniana AG]
MSAMDLDLPLEDVIKKSKNKGKVVEKSSGRKTAQHSKHAIPVAKQLTQRGGKIGKSYTQGKGVAKKNGPPPKPKAGLFSSAASKRGGLSTAALRSHLQKPQRISKQQPIDPASIVITKKVTPKAPAQPQPPRAKAPTAFRKATPPAHEPTNTIRGRSGVVNPGLSIRGESGPTVVLVRNLDPGANADDVRMAFLSFGEVLNCELAVDRSGRSLGEAEVEFAHKSAAVQAVQQLDGELADGRVLRLSLRDKVTSSKPARGLFEQSVRSMIAPVKSERSSVFDRR